MPTVETVLL